MTPNTVQTARRQRAIMISLENVAKTFYKIQKGKISRSWTVSTVFYFLYLTELDIVVPFEESNPVYSFYP